MPANAGGAVLLNFPNAGGQAQSAAVSANTARQPESVVPEALDLGNDQYQNDVDLYSDLYDGVQEVNTFVSDLMAKGINPAQPDPRNPESFAYNRAYRTRMGQLQQMANDLRIGAEAEKEYQKRRLESGLTGQPLNTSGGPTKWSDLNNITQNDPITSIVQEANKQAIIYQRQGAYNEAQARLDDAVKAIEQVGSTMISAGENPQNVMRIKESAIAQLNTAIYQPPTFAPQSDGGGGAPDKSAKVFSEREMLVRMVAGNRGNVEQARNAVKQMVGKQSAYGLIEGAGVEMYDANKAQATGQRGKAYFKVKLAQPVIVPKGKENEYPDSYDYDTGNGKGRASYYRWVTIPFEGDGSVTSPEFGQMANILMFGMTGADKVTIPELLIGETKEGIQAVTGPNYGAAGPMTQPSPNETGGTRPTVVRMDRAPKDAPPPGWLGDGAYQQYVTNYGDNKESGMVYKDANDKQYFRPE